MKTIIDTASTVSKYLFADDKTVTMGAGSISVGDPVEFIICDMNTDNATLVESVTEPDDWYGCKYKYANSTWAVDPDWVDPREEDAA